MNRKSCAFPLRKSSRHHDGQIPSAGAPSSARRALLNRTALDPNRLSLGSGRPSQYGLKDTRVLNEDFIHQTFVRLKEWLSQMHLNADVVPNSPKLTMHQSAAIFALLIRQIEPSLSPPEPSGANITWLEQEVPALMEVLGYQVRVTKSMLQTVSSKPGPVVGIIQYLLEVATAIVGCDTAQAVRLLAKGDDPLERDVEELGRTSFMRGVSLNSEQLAAHVKQICVKHKGIVDETEIEAEREKLTAELAVAEAELNKLESQFAERDTIEEECRQLRDYLERMKSRQASRLAELASIREQLEQLATESADIQQAILETNRLIEAQPMTVEEIRALKAQATDLENTLSTSKDAIRTLEKEIESFTSALRVASAELESVCGELACALANAPSDVKIPQEGILAQRNVSKDDIKTIVSKTETCTSLHEKITSEYDRIVKQMSEQRVADDQRVFELSQKVKQLQTEKKYASQDEEALIKKLDYFNDHLAKKEKELFRFRGETSDLENTLVFRKTELNDLKEKLTRMEMEHQAAKDRLVREQEVYDSVHLLFENERARTDRVIALDHDRMQKLVLYYKKSFANLELSALEDDVLEKINSVNVILDLCRRANVKGSEEQ